ncbi:MAG: hypothetical protein NTX02_02030, partial [Planctomycetia bacterium]|nr:hypothetical protein [Planctomycetia bacterium]
WRAGLAALEPTEQFDEIICANDSVYGPLFDLAAALSDARVADADLWGMCLSEQGTKRRGKISCPHIQSWFFGMRRPLIASQAFADFWRSVVPLEHKDDLIDRYELGMTEHFAAAGFRVAALYDARTAEPLSLREMWPHFSLREPRRLLRLLKKSRRPRHNPSELAYKRLLDAGVPFAKVSLFRLNHYGLNLEHVMESLQRENHYDIHLIRDHLERTGTIKTHSSILTVVKTYPAMNPADHNVSAYFFCRASSLGLSDQSSFK